jgi:cyanophycinase-like exopeptidase
MRRNGVEMIQVNQHAHLRHRLGNLITYLIQRKETAATDEVLHCLPVATLGVNSLA